MKYKVEFFQDEIYQVCEVYDGYSSSAVFQGNLADCNAWLQLNDKGYL